MNNSKNNYLPFLLLFIQPIFMASNLIVARGGVEYVPPISLAFWRWTAVFLILLPFTYSSLKKHFKFEAEMMIFHCFYKQNVISSQQISIFHWF